MALSVDLVVPTKTIARGTDVMVYGDFSEHIGKEFRVYVGPSGDDSDAMCLSGKPGAPYAIFPITAERMRFYLPEIEVGGPYNIFVRRKDETEEALLATAIEIVEAPYYSSVFSLRTVLPPYYKTGPRSMELLEQVP